MENIYDIYIIIPLMDALGGGGGGGGRVASICLIA